MLTLFSRFAHHKIYIVATKSLLNKLEIIELGIHILDSIHHVRLCLYRAPYLTEIVLALTVLFEYDTQQNRDVEVKNLVRSSNCALYYKWRL